MAKLGNDKTLSRSLFSEWDEWGAACGFTNWEHAAEALGISRAHIFNVRKKPPSRTMRLAMTSVLLERMPGQKKDEPVPRDMTSAPRDGTMLRLLVRFTEHATDDAEEAWTIGSNSFDANGEDEWQFAGWCWEHDHFTEGKGTPIGWLPMFDEQAQEKVEPVGVIEREFRDVGGYTAVVSWSGGEHPGVGTKLYTTPPAAPDGDSHD